MAGSTLLLVAVVAALLKLTFLAGFVMLRRKRRGLHSKWYSAPRRV
jgi:hypothetical protein